MASSRCGCGVAGFERRRALGRNQRYEGALLDRRAGTIQPLAFVRGLAKVAIELGASVFTRSVALRREDVAGRWKISTVRGSGTRIHRDWSRRELARLFPQLGEVPIEHEWFGMIGMTADALPRLHIHDRQVFSISGYNGRGIGPGTVMGRNLAQLALGEVA